jgi:hypothetical protein
LDLHNSRKDNELREYCFIKSEYLQVVENSQHDSKNNHNNATMPQETGHKAKNMNYDVEEIPGNDKDQYQGNDKDSQLEELVKGNIRKTCHRNRVSQILSTLS